MNLTDAFTTVWPRILVWDLGRYMLAASLFAGVAALAARSAWRVRRIQDRIATSADRRREILASLRTCVIFSLVGLGVFTAQHTGLFRMPPRPPGHGLGLLELAVMLIAQDTYFYWTHRAMHHPRLFRWMHRVHHQSVTPTPFAAYAFSVPEALVQAAFVVLWVALVPTPNVVVLTFMLVQILRNAWGHSGFELHPPGFADHPVFGQLTTTVHHDLHHGGGFDSNYGLWFSWWDRWMGTEHPAYRERYRALTAAVPLTAPAKAV